MLRKSFCSKKSRINWLKLGDENNKFFFNSCKGRWNKNKLLALYDNEGNLQTNHEDISSTAVNYFQNLLGTTTEVEQFPDDLSIPFLSKAQQDSLTQPVSSVEIFLVFKHMAANKSPGSDGFSSEFFVKAWSIVGDDVVSGIQSFFTQLKLPRIVNSTAIALVPKQEGASQMSHFRHISCCNVIYKLHIEIVGFQN